jgi:hypothetical protein
VKTPDVVIRIVEPGHSSCSACKSR